MGGIHLFYIRSIWIIFVSIITLIIILFLIVSLIIEYSIKTRFSNTDIEQKFSGVVKSKFVDISEYYNKEVNSPLIFLILVNKESLR